MTNLVRSSARRSPSVSAFLRMLLVMVALSLGGVSVLQAKAGCCPTGAEAADCAAMPAMDCAASCAVCSGQGTIAPLGQILQSASARPLSLSWRSPSDQIDRHPDTPPPRWQHLVDM